jgi:hypothetical protein
MLAAFGWLPVEGSSNRLAPACQWSTSSSVVISNEKCRAKFGFSGRSQPLYSISCDRYYIIGPSRCEKADMTSRLGSNFCSDRDLMCAGVIDALQALQAETELDERSLPLAPKETPFIVLTCAGDSIGVVDAPSCPPASSCSFYCLQKRAKAGRAAAFVLAPPAGVIYGDSHAAVLSTLAALVLVNAEQQQPDDLGAPPAQLPVAYELSILHGGVLISAAIPASAPEGSRVVISRVSVAGYDVALGEAPLEVIVGFNHDSAPQGPVIAAAGACNVQALNRLLEGGASTEETDRVGGGRLAHSDVE